MIRVIVFFFGGGGWGWGVGLCYVTWPLSWRECSNLNVIPFYFFPVFLYQYRNRFAIFFFCATFFAKWFTMEGYVRCNWAGGGGENAVLGGTNRKDLGGGGAQTAFLLFLGRLYIKKMLIDEESKFRIEFKSEVMFSGCYEVQMNSLVSQVFHPNSKQLQLRLDSEKPGSCSRRNWQIVASYKPQVSLSNS